MSIYMFMISNQYVEITEPLYYMCRLDRYTPATAKYISMGRNVITPLTQAEIVCTISGNMPASRELSQRGLNSAGCSGINLGADNNHSIYWDNSFVHAIDHSVAFWNLDDDFKNIITEAFKVDGREGRNLARVYLFSILEDDAEFTDSLSRHSDLDLMHWIDERRGLFSPAPDPDNYDSDIAEKYYDSFDKIIFDPLLDAPEFNDNIQQLLLRKIKEEGIKTLD